MKEQLAEKGAEAAQGAAQTMRNRPNDTISLEGRLAAQEMEQISGREGSLTVPREIMERGMDNVRPSRTGIPGG